jgi:hypothetical protein
MTTPRLTAPRLEALRAVDAGDVQHRWPIGRGAPYWLLRGERVSRQATFKWLQEQQMIRTVAGSFGTMGRQSVEVTERGRAALDDAIAS